MRILVDINHPAHVHLFKYFIREMEKKGHEFLIVARRKEVTFDLLREYQFSFIPRKGYDGLFGKTIGLAVINLQLLRLALRFRPDILTGMNNIYVAEVAAILRKPSLLFNDTEDMKLVNFLAHPFATRIITPSCYAKEHGEKHVRYDGFQELAYLHPNWFEPDPSVLDMLQVKKNEAFFLLRFVSWKAGHDIAEKGLSNEAKIRICTTLEQHGKVFISSEKKLEREFEKYRLPIPPGKIHSAMYYAQMLVCDSQTMATEAGLLGTPAIRCNSLVGSMHGKGNFDELEKYGLVYSLSDENKVFGLIDEFLGMDNLKQEFSDRKNKMLLKKNDVTRWMVDYVSQYVENNKQ
jgi:predicted glycosyltransferase